MRNHQDPLRQVVRSPPAFLPSSADDAFHIGLHDQLQHGFGNAEQKATLIVLSQKLGQVHAAPWSLGPVAFPWLDLGHRGLR